MTFGDTITFEQAKELLNGCTREELRDHSFGDREISWFRGSDIVADGYVGSNTVRVSVCTDGSWYKATTFVAAEATELLTCGTVGTIERNDTTGPDTYTEGQTMPGLTLAGVKKELCE